MDPGSEAVVRICVDGVGSRDVALGAGRVAFPGMPAEGELSVTVDVLATTDTGADAVRTGRAGPVVLTTADPVQQATWTPCDTDACVPCREAAAPVDTGGGTRLLAVRFPAAE